MRKYDWNKLPEIIKKLKEEKKEEEKPKKTRKPRKPNVNKEIENTNE